MAKNIDVPIPLNWYTDISPVKALFNPTALRTTVVDLLIYVHGNHLRSCRDGQLT